MIPAMGEWFNAVDHTWPAFSMVIKGKWSLREGRNAGQRVSAASTNASVTTDDVEFAAQEMREMGQNPLFMVRGAQPELDALLDNAGYKIVDPVDVLAAPCCDLAHYEQQSLRALFSDRPLAKQIQIWRDGGIDLPRLKVMQNAEAPKTYLFSRLNERAAGVGFIACHKTIAMVHAVEVLPDARRQGVAESLMRGAAWWAMQQGMAWFSCLATSENLPAQRLYRKMGMDVVAQYHYRKWVA